MHELVNAFAKGRAAHKRTVGEYFEVKGKTIKSCAVGAVYYGLYGRVPKEDESVAIVPTQIVGDWPQVRTAMFPIPCKHKVVYDKGELEGDKGNIVGILIHLNDLHGITSDEKWTDKKIQDWLATTLEEYDRNQALPQV